MNIKTPKDIKKLNINELEELSKDIRKFLVLNLSKTGGHLSSNLGVVELTLALHYIFDSPKDNIIFDVSHQGYVHKILTGRSDRFDTLRQLDGLSGYLKRDESIHDKFGAGHASTSLSALSGFSFTDKLSGNDNYNIAVIGDASLSGGMVFEALNIIGEKKQDVLIIINDNDMSINENVGAINNILTDLRTYKGYNRFKSYIKDRINKKAKNRLTKIKNTFKHMFMPSNIFEDMNLRYYGPIDGHNIKGIIEYLDRLKNIKGPKVLHILTKKGKGYKYSESSPDIYHGVSKFNVMSKIERKSGESYSEAFGNKMIELATKDDKVIAITAAMPEGTGLLNYSKKFKDRFLDVAIAEQNAVTTASAMALNGYKPYVAIYSTFLQRAFDQLIHDVSLQNANVVFCLDRSGVVGNDGETHQGIFDTSYLQLIPNMCIMCPKDLFEFNRILDYSLEYNGPIAIKYPRDKVVNINEDKTEINKNELIEKSSDTLVISYGRTIKTIVDLDVDILNHRVIKPIDYDFLDSLIEKYKRVFVIEESIKTGSLAVNLKAKYQKIKIFTLPDKFIEHGDTLDVLDRYGFTKEKLKRFIDEN